MFSKGSEKGKKNKGKKGGHLTHLISIFYPSNIMDVPSISNHENHDLEFVGIYIYIYI